MSRAIVLALAAVGCATELGPTAPWIDVADLGGPLTPSWASAPGPTPASAGRLRVASYNVEKGADVDGLARAIRANPALARADVLLLQELEDHPGEGGARAARLAAALAMGYVYAPERIEGDGTHGPAILTRWPLAQVQTMALPYADLAISRAPRIALAADVVVGAQVVRVIDLHLDTRLSATERILQMRPAVRDAPWPTIVGGDLNTNPYLWAEGAVPQLPAGAVVDTDQAPVIDDYMRHLEYATPTAALGPTLVFGGVIEARLDAIYARGVTVMPGAVERSLTLSDHWPVWIDVELP